MCKQVHLFSKPQKEEIYSPVTEALAFLPHSTSPSRGRAGRRKKTVLSASSKLSGEGWSPAERDRRGKKKKAQLKPWLNPAKLRVCFLNVLCK